jgi:hypothetical protein
MQRRIAVQFDGQAKAPIKPQRGKVDGDPT